MGRDSKIEWTHHTFNPWWGCQRVSPGCVNCYAESLATRYGHNIWGIGERRFFADKHWNDPVKWDRLAAERGVRERVFCGSMCDVFEDREDLHEHRHRLFELIERTPSLDWLLLTKRANKMLELAPRWWEEKWPDNVWAMATAENQERLNTQALDLMKVPAKIRGLSMEPLLEEVAIPYGWLMGPDAISWVIVGGESGPGARPMRLDWARSLRDQCKAAGVAFLFKQWGEWIPEGQGNEIADAIDPANGKRHKGPRYMTDPDDMTVVVRVGKKAAGCMLDGQEHKEFPC